jgi:hypothetical protein
MTDATPTERALTAAEEAAMRAMPGYGKDVRRLFATLDAERAARAPENGEWTCDWTPDDLNPGPECPYCAGRMCARFDGLRCTHDLIERHGYGAARAEPGRDVWEHYDADGYCHVGVRPDGPHIANLGRDSWPDVHGRAESIAAAHNAREARAEPGLRTAAQKVVDVWNPIVTVNVTPTLNAAIAELEAALDRAAAPPPRDTLEAH